MYFCGMMWWLVAAMVMVAFLYASVGHGGASGYIALLALASWPAAYIRQDALILNLLVSGMAFWNFYKQGHFHFSAFWPLALFSVPASFWGGSMAVDADLYKKILGVLLLVPAIWFLLDQKPAEAKARPRPFWVSAILGTGLGFISGLTGIGGGVFLSPILILGRWSGQKETAALAAPFIFVNSAAGLLGSQTRTPKPDPYVLWFAAAALAGGFAGAYAGAGKISAFGLKKILSVVLILASLKLIFA